jgi:hypothetical protein
LCVRNVYTNLSPQIAIYLRRGDIRGGVWKIKNPSNERNMNDDERITHD